jgi:hypothetical protein
MPLALNVPWYQREKALQAGAVRDPESRQWYVPDEDLNGLMAFEQWFCLLKPNVILTDLALFSTTVMCPACEWPTTIYGLSAMTRYVKQSVYYHTNWYLTIEHQLVCDVTAMDAATAKILRRSAPTFYKDREPLYKGKEWVNHCSHCRHIIGNHLLYGPDQYFCDELRGKDFEERLLETPYFSYLHCHYGYAWEAQIISDKCYRQ